MPSKQRYCSQCGAATVTRRIALTAREVCPACGTILYRNPLPVAATVVLNARREVLLVKRLREPQRGMWCLPIGFAELEETIAEAALRELREEAGITGCIERLLDVDTYKSDFYGDLLIVTFEAAMIGGTPSAGDDAAAIGWFPITAPPMLAFSANQKALAACHALHHDEWAIHDSFDRLRQDSDAALLSDALVDLIRSRADEILELWLTDVRSNPTTASYGHADPDHLRSWAATTLERFSRWLKGAAAQEEVRSFYRTLGSERRAGGFALHEVLSALTLLRKHLYARARGQGMWRRPIDVYRVLELDRRMVLFFDRAMYHIARGFTAEPSGGGIQPTG